MREEKGSVLPRKEPIQSRGMLTVQRILDATMEILEQPGTRHLNTSQIAKQAGVNIAALYQFFPNKKAIFYALYQQWLDRINAGYDQVEKEFFGEAPWREFFARLRQKRFEVALNPVAEINLDYLMSGSVELEALDTIHANLFAYRLTNYLKGYGSNWPDDKLQSLALLLYEIGWATTHRLVDESEMNMSQTLEWATMVHMSLIERCLQEQAIDSELS